MKENDFFVFVIVILISITIIPANPTIQLIKGKNNISFDFAPNLYASDLVKAYPEIISISYIENEKSLGYVNVFGGIGKDFPIQGNESYEIIVSKNITLILRK